MSETGLRLDKWLWHARFCKSRTLAAQLAGATRSIATIVNALARCREIMALPRRRRAADRHYFKHRSLTGACLAWIAHDERATEIKMEHEKPAFRKPGDPATLPELIKFLNDRSGYIRTLEEEATPESFSRIENLKELANAAQDAQERGETLHEFLDHAALVSDTASLIMIARWK